MSEKNMIIDKDHLDALIEGCGQQDECGTCTYDPDCERIADLIYKLDKELKLAGE